ncbi:hypothetical protein SAMN05444851_0547 [Aliiroseovarius sediminilitoris]|uniref:DUF6473 domain-containing protein n=1 Tax=Aliiroseovarius sediminilitoris TaxID=1173584 RepID=A0A1I0N469_9RHOB|nr:DUF6473 family protein [Aliiroseovarius sediminilitoris]SEV95897.1 hypothetical protein SAMN05444851_0547 [Aliiroseovarius sediminilitoris]
MAYDTLGKGPLNYQLCRYGTSKILFRGPKKKLATPYIAVLGGTETFGKYLPHPYPDLLQLELGLQVANFGCQNAGVDAFLHDHGLLTLCNRAKVTVLQVPGAHNMSNRFYSVHPRRNDRFLRGSNLLKELYGEIDLTEFNFTRHLLTALHDTSAERFAKIVQELRTAWVARMKLLIAKLDCEVVLLWLADHRISEGAQNGINGSDPLFVDRDMVRAIAPFVADVVEVAVSRQQKEDGHRGLVYADMDEPATRDMLGNIAHQNASRAVHDAIDRLR